jgi:hypothetical protein
LDLLVFLSAVINLSRVALHPSAVSQALDLLVFLSATTKARLRVALHPLAVSQASALALLVFPSAVIKALLSVMLQARDPLQAALLQTSLAVGPPDQIRISPTTISFKKKWKMRKNVII